jgi:hypothetical protein
MEVLLTKSQKKGMMGMGAVSFILEIQARLTEEEKALVKRYKMDDIIIFEKMPVNAAVSATGVVGKLAIGLASKVFQLQFYVKDLVNGRKIEAKDISEMIAAEAQIRGAAENFHNMLMASKYFEGEEVISFKDE